MNKFERAELDLSLILPYVNHLKEVVNQGKRIEKRSFQIPSGVIFEDAEVKEMQRSNREIPDTGEFDSQGEKI